MLTNAPVAAVLPSTDLGRSKAFYENKLSLKAKQMGMDETDMLVFEAGAGTMLAIYKRPPVKVDYTQAGFMVEDIEATMRKLKDKGVVFEKYDMPGLKTVNGVATAGKTKSAWFKDPDGNILAINEM